MRDSLKSLGSQVLLTAGSIGTKKLKGLFCQAWPTPQQVSYQVCPFLPIIAKYGNISIGQGQRALVPHGLTAPHSPASYYYWGFSPFAYSASSLLVCIEALNIYQLHIVLCGNRVFWSYFASIFGAARQSILQQSNHGSAHFSIPTFSMVSHDHSLICMLTSDHQSHIKRQAPCHVT